MVDDNVPPDDISSAGNVSGSGTGWRAESHDESTPGCGARHIDKLSDTAPITPHQLPQNFPGRIGDYCIIREIARGGTSVVFRAMQESLNRDVAIKVLHTGDHLARTLARYERELRALTQLKHPAITTVLDAGVVQVGLVTVPYIVMDFIPGVSLDQFVRDNDLDVDSRLRLFIEICEAVAAAHRQGIIHRDLKPSNILVTPDGRPHICDFGIARIHPTEAETLPPLTASHEIVGTLQYMSPEHVGRSSTPVDTRSDVYSLGLILFEMLTNQRAYDTAGQTVVQAIVAICEEQPVSIRQLNPSLPRDLEIITAKAIEKDPDARYATVDAFAADVAAFLNHNPITARPIGVAGHVWRWSRRRPGTAVASLAAVLALVVGIVVSSYYAWQAEIHATESDQRLQQLTHQSQKLADQTLAAESAATRAQRTAFNAMLGRIHRFTVSDPELANELLDDSNVCPAELHSFAWRYLKNQNHTLVKVLAGHPKGTSRISFNADSSRLISTGADAKIRFWDLASGELIARHPCLSAGEPFAVSPSGDQVASAGPDSSIIIIPIKAGDPQPHLSPKTGGAERVCFIPQTDLVAIGTRSGTVEIWDQVRRTNVITLDAGLLPVWHLDAIDTGHLNCINSGGEVNAWETENWEPLLAHRISDFKGVVELARRHRWLITGRRDGRVDVYRNSVDLTENFRAGYGLRDLQVCLNGDSVLVAQHRRVESFDVHTGAQTGLFRHPDGEVTSIAVGGSPENQLLAISSLDGPISIYELGPSDMRTADLTLHEDHRLVDVAYSPDGRYLATLVGAGIIRLLDAETLREVVAFKINEQCIDLDWHPDSNLIVVATRIKGNTASSGAARPGVAVIKVSDQTANENDCVTSEQTVRLTLEAWWPPDRMISHVSVSPDGKYAAASGRRDEVSIIEIATGRRTARVTRRGTGARIIRFSPSSQFLAIGYAEGDLKLIDVTSGAEHATAEVARGGIQSCVFSHDGSTLYGAGGPYGEVYCWSVPDLELQRTFRGPREVSKAIALSPDGRTLAVGSRDHLVTIMDAETGDVQLALKAHTWPVTSLSFSPDGTALATGSATQLRVMDAPRR
ncbi:MAG: WD40 repeat domain-containing serine/threonine protein kinase [Planctomycetota bacterium]|jgi:serine/threonine protein kinase/WD40 repeat protein